MILATTAATQQIEVAPLAPLLDRLIAAGMTLGLATNDSEAPARAHLEARRHPRPLRLRRRLRQRPRRQARGPGCSPPSAPLTGIPPAACAMIGDSTHDLDSGRAAGMTTIAVLTGLATRADLEPHADVVLPDISALPDWLGI